MKFNMIHLYVGSGKGKTCASYGLALRALGSGLKVSVFSFLKSKNSGEITFLKQINENFGYPHINISPKDHKLFFLLSEEEKNEVKCEICDLFSNFKQALLKEDYDLIILDEIVDAVNLELIDEDELISLLSERKAEIVLTGRNPSEKLSAIADYISDVNKIKHPYDNGISARKGIEY